MAKFSLVRGRHTKNHKKELNDYEAVKEKLEKGKRARYGSKEIKVFLKEEVLQHGYTQNS